jgi:hypothetical protein
MNLQEYKLTIIRAVLIVAALVTVPIAILKVVEVAMADKPVQRKIVDRGVNEPRKFEDANPTSILGDPPTIPTMDPFPDEDSEGTLVEYEEGIKEEAAKKDSDYSPGKGDWKVTQEQQKITTQKTAYDLYVVSLEKWAKPQLDDWTCQACKQVLSKDFSFESRDNGIIKFGCKCYCGHTHIIPLKAKQ